MADTEKDEQSQPGNAEDSTLPPQQSAEDHAEKSSMSADSGSHKSESIGKISERKRQRENDGNHPSKKPSTFVMTRK